MVTSLLGGLGMFLLGMVLLTEGLKALAGDALRRILMRFVSGPVTGVAWGTLVTALVQSSTATTVMTVGFVSAGLMTFAQSVGVIFGANLGTTSTGWIVSQLGFKVPLEVVAPPIVLVGAAFRLLTRGKPSHFGTAIAGFGLLFIGIDMLQQGMSGAASHVSPADLPGLSGGMTGRAMLMGFGFLLTLVMQSSSASMATTLAAVASGAIDLTQAAALIVGQNIGTTPTAIAASIGGPAAAKRTALAHVLFNVLTAGVAFLTLPWMLRASEWVAASVGMGDEPTVLAAFHTSFNLMGIALLLPMVRPYSRLIEWLIPERNPRATRFISAAVAEVGPVALEAARRGIAQVVGEVACIGKSVLATGQVYPTERAMLSEARGSLAEVRRFVHGLGRAAQAGSEVDRQVALLHAGDHADRLIDALEEPSSRVPETDEAAARAAASVSGMLASIAGACKASVSEPRPSPKTEHAGAIAATVPEAERLSLEIAALRKAERKSALHAAAAGRLEPDAAMARIDALLWLDRVMYHLWRCAHYLREEWRTHSNEGGEPLDPSTGSTQARAVANSVADDLEGG